MNKWITFTSTYQYLLGLRVTQKALQLPFFLFSYFSLSCRVFKETGKRFLLVFRQLLLQIHISCTGCTSWTNWEIVLPTSSNFVCESMKCHVLQRQTKLTDLSKHVESCFSTTKSIKSLLPHHLQRPKLAE